jgi:hypothetical protein
LEAGKGAIAMTELTILGFLILTLAATEVIAAMYGTVMSARAELHR